MRHFVISGDKYSFLLGLYAELFNKHWPGQEVVIICYDESRVPELPDNFSVISAGRQADFGKAWTDGLIPIFRDLPDEFFTVLLDDLFLVQPVPMDLVEYMITEVQEGRAAKVMLHCHLPGKAIRPGVAELDQSANYRTALHPSIWRKDYFTRFLIPGYDPRDFEAKGMVLAKNDGERVLRSDGVHVFNCLNVYRSGEPVLKYPSSEQYPVPCPPVDPDDLRRIRELVAGRTFEEEGVW